MTRLMNELGKRTLIMGIVNATPDSFSDGGKYNSIDQAVLRAKQLVEDGADIIDVGGESTRPGFEAISVEEEIERVIPIISAIRQAVDVAISIDTYKSAVAEQAILAGADIVNDIWGCKADPNMAQVIAKYKKPIVLMHNRDNKEYNHIIQDIQADLQESILLAEQAGVAKEYIWLDPGIGFAKDYEDNLTTIAHLDRLVALGYPVLLGTSRKGFIGITLDLPVEERLEGSLATVCYGVQKGCQIVRVHDVKETARVCKMIDTIKNREGA
ncbi:dihydropteroate synthase [Ammoniphilus oxalaticus]|nr:dihydropteroate synthase [Ammoniphilus oxalaticus]